MEYKKVKPIFNYIGGKSWLRTELRKATEESLKNNDIDTYCEPFSGALGAFLGVYDVLIKYGVKNVIINDINSHLISIYSNLQNNKQTLLEEIEKIEKDFLKTIPEETFLLHKTKDKIKIKELLKEANNFYKKQRDTFNKSILNKSPDAASLIFLQSHCFNGVYRENSKGYYNTPFNWEANKYKIEIMEKKLEELEEVFSYFNIQFLNKNYDEIEYNEKTLYYVDPPYLNEDSKIENKYNKNVFNIEDQKKLISLIKNKNFIYSNHYNSILINELQFNKNIDIKQVARKNIISSNNESRKNDKIEILASNRIK